MPGSEGPGPGGKPPLGEDAESQRRLMAKTLNPLKGVYNGSFKGILRALG